ncbi:MAG TPA: alpha/beta fold hydrolase [Thermodesulfobacteriota bacterium]|nr:alpha/beta fold hydrolase [Thermodesulfobacteriota bacterium]
MYDKHQRFITFQAEDGFQVHSLLLSKEFDNKYELSNTPIIIHIHGVLGHSLARGSPRLLPPALLEHGISSFSMNTRMAFVGQIFGEGVFDDAIKDVDAAVNLLKEEGFRKIFILGYSLGANIAAHYVAERPDAGLCGLILEGTAFSLPDSQKKRWEKWKSIPSYDDVYRKAKDILRPDPYNSPNDQVFIVYRAWGDTFNPFHQEIYTYKTWWFMRSPEAENAKTYKLMPKIKVPALFLQGENDDIVGVWEGKELARLVREAGNSEVTVKYIPHAKHDCMENSDETIRTIVGWISSLNSGQKIDR